MEQRTDEWFKARLGIPTASNYGAVLAGKTTAARRNYIARCVVERLTGKPVETYQNAAMLDGIEREPVARSLYEMQQEVFVQEVGFLRHSSVETGGSPDGLVGDDGIIEIKCPTLATHLDYLGLDYGEAPSQYVPQIQGLLWITERSWCDFISYNPDFPEKHRLVVRRILRDEDYIEKLRGEIVLFVREVSEKWQALC